jgi:alpha/beta superfamily hydrolase
MVPRAETDDLMIEDIAFRSGDYCLRGELVYRDTGLPRGAVVLAGPHPLLGGNMHNNVVRGLGDGLARRGLMTLRFDYRGVGRSEGPTVDVAQHLAVFWQTAHAPGEMDFALDLQAAVAYVRESDPHLPLALIGYSFGCALLPRVKPMEAVAALALIAPTIVKHDYHAYRAVQRPLLVVASDDDFANDADRLESWLGTLTMPRQTLRAQCDSHFFRGHEVWLVDRVGDFLDRHWRRS